MQFKQAIENFSTWKKINVKEQTIRGYDRELRSLCVFLHNPEILEVHIFRADKFLGEPTESEEMKPRWFHINDIPFKDMWPDDKYWIPLLLSGKKFKGKFLFGESDVILEQELSEVKEI